MSDKAFYGYLAGLLDGEGHITISRCKVVKRRVRVDGSLYERPDTIQYQMNLGITNTDMRLMDWLQGRLGGKVYQLKRCHKNPKWKHSCKWQYTKHSDGEKLLLAVLPYLVLKKEQAKVMLEFLRLEGQYVPEKRQELYEKMIKLNERGIGSVETNTQDAEKSAKIESELISNNKNDAMVT